jgi:20S proteasome alpha/beta subunit
MTLIVGMKADNAIILAADSRGMMGDPRGLTAINDNQIKLYSLGRCGFGLAGASELGASLLDEYRKKGFDKLTSIDEIASKISQESSDLFNKWLGDIPREKRPAVVLTLAGFRKVDSTKPESMIFMLDSSQNFAPMLMGKYPTLTGIPQYAIYLANRYYDPSISTERAKALAEYLISETASQETKVGGRIRMAIISPKDGYNELTEEDVKAISDENAALNKSLREFFLKGGPK